MARLELSDGLSNEACVSLGNKLGFFSEAVTPLAPPAVRPLICAVSDDRGVLKTKHTRLAGKRSREKKGNGMSHATCMAGAFTFHFSHWEFYTCK